MHRHEGDGEQGVPDVRKDAAAGQQSVQAGGGAAQKLSVGPVRDRGRTPTGVESAQGRRHSECKK